MLDTTDPQIRATATKNLERIKNIAQQLSDYIGSNKSILLTEEEDKLEVEEEIGTITVNRGYDQVGNNNIRLWGIWEQFEKLMGFLPPAETETKLSNNELSDSSFVVLDTEKEYTDQIQKLKEQIEELKEENASLNARYDTLLKQQNVPNAVKDLLQENTMLKKSISNFRYQVQKHYSESMRNSNILFPGSSFMHPPRVIPAQPVPSPTKNAIQPTNNNEETILHLKRLLASKDKEIEELKKYKVKYTKIIDKAKKKKEGSIYMDSTTSSGSRI